VRLLVFNTQHASPARARRQAAWIASQHGADHQRACPFWLHGFGREERRGDALLPDCLGDGVSGADRVTGKGWAGIGERVGWVLQEWRSEVAVFRAGRGSRVEQVGRP
jgi:hypothetical protein